MKKRNCKVHANIGDSLTRLLRTLSVIDTGARPNFIRKNALPAGDLTPLSYEPLPDIADANSNPIQLKGITRLLVRLKTRAYWVEFIVVEYQTPGAGWDGGCKAPPSNRSLGITRRPVPQRHK